MSAAVPDGFRLFCGECFYTYRTVTNALTGKPLSVPSCRHATKRARVHCERCDVEFGPGEQHTCPPLPKLSPAQCALLDEINGAGTLYIKTGSRWSRSVEVLCREGLVVRVERDHSRERRDGWALTDQGRAVFPKLVAS